MRRCGRYPCPPRDLANWILVDSSTHNVSIALGLAYHQFNSFAPMTGIATSLAACIANDAASTPGARRTIAISPTAMMLKPRRRVPSAWPWFVATKARIVAPSETLRMAAAG